MKTNFCLALAVALILPAAAQTVTPAQRSVHSGIPTNAWVAVTSPTTLKSVLVANASAADCWVYIFDSNTNQLDNTRSNACAYKVTAGTATFWNPPDGERFNRGVTIAQSTTFPTLTNVAAGSAALVVTVKHTP